MSFHPLTRSDISTFSFEYRNFNQAFKSIVNKLTGACGHEKMRINNKEADRMHINW
jgi:hypothetical protein